MKLVGHLSWAPPFPGSNHTCWPIGDKPYLIVTDEARAKQKYWDAQFMWIIDARKEDRLTPIATFMPDRDKYFNRPGRYGAHNILEREIAVRRAVEGHRVPDLLQRGAARGRTSAIRSIPRRRAATCRRSKATARRCSRTTSAPTSTAGSI